MSQATAFPHPSPPSPTGRGRLLLTAATAMELEPLRLALAAAPAGEVAPPFVFLVCGVGPTATAATLAAHLATRGGEYAGVVITGVAGAYPAAAAGVPALLDICLAEREVLADFGLAAPHGAEPFGRPELDGEREFSLSSPLLTAACRLLAARRIPFHVGSLVTVNAASTTRERGRALARRYRARWENMEGAAAALVCARQRLPLLEFRCVSNLVEDRDLNRWRLPEAVARNAEVLAPLLPELRAELVANSFGNGPEPSS